MFKKINMIRTILFFIVFGLVSLNAEPSVNRIKECMQRGLNYTEYNKCLEGVEKQVKQKSQHKLVKIPLEECMKASSSNVEMIQCINKKQKIQNKLLDKNYKELLKAYKGTPKQKELKKSQKVWIKFRNYNCNKFYIDKTSGEYWEKVEPKLCILKSTEERVGMLQPLLKGEGWLY